MENCLAIFFAIEPVELFWVFYMALETSTLKNEVACSEVNTYLNIRVDVANWTVFDEVKSC